MMNSCCRGPTIYTTMRNTKLGYTDNGALHTHHSQIKINFIGSELCVFTHQEMLMLSEFIQKNTEKRTKEQNLDISSTQYGQAHIENT